MKIVVHTLVKNEDQWIWYAINSVIDYVDEIMVWDTGSTDLTIPIIKSIKSPKIKFKSLVASTPDSITFLRQEMWNQTKADWIMILDGDEIWPHHSLMETLNVVYNSRDAYIINRTFNMVGDIFHYQEKLAGKYKIGHHSGHLTVRFHNLLHLKNAKFYRGYPDEGLVHPSGVTIQNYLPDTMPLVESPYLHATHLRRTSLPQPLTISRSHLVKYELGKSLPSNYVFPACFYFPKPQSVPSPWTPRNNSFLLNAAWQTPLKMLKRRLSSK